MNKTCSKCQTEKTVEEFPKEKSRKDGLYPWCKVCLSFHRKERYVKRLKQFKITHKVCSYCEANKPRAEFDVWESSRNLQTRCKSCVKEIEDNTALGKRRCGCCKKWLKLSRFFKSRREGHHATCKKCTRAKMTTKEVHEYRRNKDLLKYYGITLTQYRELLEKQNHTCPVCLKPLEGISNHVDHAHRGQHEGKIRAILHSRCNQMVVHNHYDSGELRRAADLIENPLTDWIVPEEYLKSRKKRRGRRCRKKRKKE